MTILHPHWQPTEEKDSGQRTEDRGKIQKGFTVPSPTSQVHSPRTVSRRPAATLGVLLALSLGVVMLRDDSPLVSTVTDDTLTITIREKSFDPDTLRVRPGQTVIWKNESTIPHIIASETLTTSEGQSLQTSPVFPGGTSEYTVPLTATLGKHEYLSQTSKLSGRLTIESAAPSAGTTTSVTDLAAPFDLAPSDSSTAPTSTSTEVPASTPTVSLPLPKNPHTVGNLPAIGTAHPPGTLNAAAAGYGAGAKAFTTPTTGPAVWIISVATLMIFLRLVRQMLRRQNVD